MSTPIPRASPRVRFVTVSAKQLQNQLEGPERAYPVYRFGSKTRFERPEVAGQTYRRHRNFP